MPVTAKLSRRFYETFGDEIANELVDWFNAVDATYRADLRELNELNFARFDAKVEQRMVELEAKLDRGLAELEAKLERGLAELEAKLDRRLAELEAKLNGRMAGLEANLERRLTGVEIALEKTRSDIIKWSFAFWIGMVVTVLVARLI